MIEDKGEIISIDKQKGIGVKVEGVENCEVCTLKASCGQKRGEILYLPYKEGFSIGDKVKIKIHSVSLLNASFVLYLIPLILFLVAILIFYFFIFKSLAEFNRALFSFFISIVVLFIYGFFLRMYDKKKKEQMSYEIEKLQ